MILNIWAILLISDWYFVWSSFAVPVTVTRDTNNDMKYGRIPSKSITFITPLTNLWRTKWTKINKFGSFLQELMWRSHKSDEILKKKTSQQKQLLLPRKNIPPLKEIFTCKDDDTICQLYSRDIFPDPSLCWKAWSIEKMRQRVDTTTNKQETMATTLANHTIFQEL